MPRGVVPPSHTCAPPWQLSWVLWPRLGHPTAKGAPKAPGQTDPAQPSQPQLGEWGSVPSLLSPAPVAATVGQGHPAGGSSGVSSAGRRWKCRQGRSQLAEDQALVVGRHVHLQAQSRAQRCPAAARAAPGPSTHHPLQAQPVGLGQLPQQRRVPQPPGGIAAGRSHGSHRGHPKQPRGHPRLGLPSGLAYLEGPRWEGASCSCRGGTEKAGWGPRSPPAPSYLCLRLRSKSTLLWGLIWPSTA